MTVRSTLAAVLAASMALVAVVSGATASAAADDTTPPSVVLSTPAGDGPYRAAFDVTVSFSEAVTGLVVGDFSVTNATLGSFSGSGTTFTVRVTPAADGAVTVDLPAGAAADAAGNASTAATSLQRAFDATAPTVALGAPTGPHREPFTVTATFSESVTGLAVGDFSVANGTVGSFSGSGTTYTVLVTPAADGTVSVGLPANAAADAAGNTSAPATSLQRDYDATAPTVTLGAPTGPHREPFTVTATFSESVTGLAVGDFSVANGTVGSFSGSGTTYTVLVTPTADGTVSVDLPADAASDTAGNGSTAAATLSRTYDATPPTVTLGAPTGPRKAPFDVTITFSESVTGLVVGDLAVTNATLGGFSGSGTTYTVRVTPTADGTVTVDLPAGKATDVAGNGSTAAVTLSRVYDTTAPTVVLTAPAGPLNAPFTVTATFSELVTGLVVGDFSVANGTLGSFSGSGTTYTVLVTPTADGTVTVGLPAGKAADDAGNGSTAAVTLSRVYDATPPTVTLGAPTGPRKAPFDVTVTFSESVSGLGLGDFAVTNGTAGSLSGSGTTYTVRVTPTTDGTVTVDLPADAASDSAGNGSTAAATLSRVYDATPPTVTLGAPTGPRKAPFDVTITFSEPVTGLVVGDLVVTNATLSGFSGSGTTYTVRVTPTADGTVTVALAADVASDAAGNGSTAAATLSRVYDTTPPTVVLTAPAGPLNAPFTVTATFSESVTGLVAGDFSLTNGTAGSLTGSGTTYTVRVTPTADGTVTVGLPADAASDAAGNGSTVAAPVDRTYDRTRPTVVLVAPDGPLNGPFTVTATFSEPVGGLVEGDFALVNGSVTSGTLSSLAGSSTTYTVQVTPTADGTVTVRLPAGSTTDAAGNTSSAAGAVQREYDGTAPTVTLTAPTGLRNAPFDVEVVFSEPVAGFDLSDFAVTNATLGDLAGSGTTYQVLVTPTADGAVTIGLPAGKVADAAGNASAASTSLTRTYDGTRPTVTLSAPTGPRPAPFTATITFSESVTGLIVGDLSVVNATLSDFAGSGTTYTVLVTPTADGTVTIGLPADAAADASGNGIPAATLTRVYDTAPPTAQLEAPAGPLRGPFVLTVTFSEPVTGLTLDDLSVSSGTLSDLTGSGATYTVRVTPGEDGTVTVGLPAGAGVDAAGNGSAAAASVQRAYDASAPTATLSAPVGPRNGPFDVTITFSEPVTGLTLDDLSYSNATLGGLAGSGTTYAVLVTPTADGTVTIGLPADAARDAAGNGNTVAAPLTRTYDSAPLTVDLSAPAGPRNAPFTVTATFSKAVSGLVVGAFAVTNAALSDFAGSGTTYTVLVTPTADGAATIGLPADAASDAAGNGSAAAATLTRTFDSVAPSVQLDAPPGVAPGPFTVTVTFSETVTGLAADDVTVGNGVVTELTGSGSVYTAAVTPAGDGAVTVDLPAAAAADAAGNPSTAAATLQRTVDATTPSVTLSAPAGAVPAAGVLVRLTFSEDVTGLTASDLVVTGGAVSGDVVPVDARRYDVRVVPSVDGALVVRLPADAVRDLAQNANVASDPLALTADVVSPTVALSAPAGPVSGTFPVTVSFSEAVTGLAAADIELGNATAGALAGSGSSYTLLVVPAGDGTVTVRLPAGSVVDGAGNPNAGSATGSVVNDQTAPVLALTRASGQGSTQHGGTVRFTATASEPVGSIDRAALRADGAGGTVGAISRVDDRTFGVAVTGMQVDGTVVLRALAGAVRDAAGIPSAAVSSGGVDWSAVGAPDLTVTPLDQSCLPRGGQIGLGLASGDDATLTVTTSSSQLLPEAGVTLRRTKVGADLTIRPRAGRSGVARVVVVARNDAGTSRQTLTVRVGTAGADRIVGGTGTDLVVGLGGDDVLSGGAGADLLCGGSGDDRLSGGGGPDVLDGQQGTDVLSGGPGKNRIVR